MEDEAQWEDYHEVETFYIHGAELSYPVTICEFEGVFFVNPLEGDVIGDFDSKEAAIQLAHLEWGLSTSEWPEE